MIYNHIVEKSSEMCFRQEAPFQVSVTEVPQAVSMFLLTLIAQLQQSPSISTRLVVLSSKNAFRASIILWDLHYRNHIQVYCSVWFYLRPVISGSYLLIASPIHPFHSEK